MFRCNHHLGSESAPRWSRTGVPILLTFGLVFGLSPSLGAQLDPDMSSAGGTAVAPHAYPTLQATADRTEASAASQLAWPDPMSSWGSAQLDGSSGFERSLESVPLECMRCIDSYVTNRHAAVGHMTPRSGDGPGDGEHTYWQPGWCFSVHGICVYVSTNTSPQELTEDVAEAVAQADVETLARIVGTEHAMVVRTRNAIQVMGCDGTTVYGNVPTDPQLLNSLQMALAVERTQQ